MISGFKTPAKALVWGFCVLAFAVASGSAHADDMTPKELKDRLNKIFYWHLSDELKLSPKQEADVVSVLETVQTKREDALKKRETALSELRKLPKDASLEKTRPHLHSYIASLETLAKLDGEEYESLKKAMGEELLGRFYIIREDVTTRVRQALKK